MSDLHRFAIEERCLRVELNGQSSTATITEFIINGRALIDWLGLERDLGNCESDLDKDMQERMPEISAHALLALQAQAPVINSLGSARVVLYRCHCGCDECGVISAQVLDLGHAIEWRDVALETPMGIEDGASGTPAPCFQFDKREYLLALQRFCSAPTA